MNVVMIIPTGIGCEIGGHAGDATPAARLLGSVCDKLILHPNVVNASDVNEMPSNALYVEGSMLDRLLEGSIELEEVKKQNKILVAVNEPASAYVVNGVSSARVTLGIDAKIIELREPFRMIGRINDNGMAGGEITGQSSLIEQVKEYKFDALAINTLIEVEADVSLYYYKNGGVNPWGGIEAIASKLITSALNKPVAHAPIISETDKELDKQDGFEFVCDPRIAPELISTCYIHCVLKGLHKAPRIGKGLSVNDIDVMVSPCGCWGKPHAACKKAGITILSVKENSTVHGNLDNPGTIPVDNYLEAAGYIAAMGAGVMPASVRRPLSSTKVIQ